MNTKELKIIEAAQKLFFRHGFKKVNMSEIAEASELSRPSVYSAFANKEAIIDALIQLSIENNHHETGKQLIKQKNLRDQLECLFDIWIVKPFASAIDNESGREMLSTIADIVPDSVNQIYKEFEACVVTVLKPAMKKKTDLSPKDLAHILSMATKGIKASSDNLPELRRLVNGLITMTLTMVDK